MLRFFRVSFLVLIAVFLCQLSFGETIRVNLSFDTSNIAIEPLDGYHRVSYKDPNAYSLAKEGAPDLPAYMVRVLVPQGSDITGITFEEKHRILLGSIMPYPFQGYEIISKPRTDTVLPDPEIYKSGLIYPAQKLIYQSVGNTRGFDILYFSYYPFEYDTNTENLYFYQSASFSIDCSPAKNPEYTDFRANETFTNMVSATVVNPEAIQKYYPEKTVFSAKAIDYDMLIVTTENLLSGAQAYADFRQSAGITSVIKTVSQIQSAYSGATTQLKIKDCINQHVQNNNVTYVFLIGDGGTDSGYSVPDQNLYGYLFMFPWPESDNTIPGDIFYSCFGGTFNWNADGDSRVGEPGDNTDISPDVIIGRLPVRTVQQILDYKNKVQSYISSVSHETFSENLLLSGVQLFDNTGDAKAKSEVMYNNYIAPYWPVHNKYTLYDSDTSVTVSSLTSMLQQNMNFFHMATHGNVTVWAMESGSDFYSSNAMALNNIPGIVVTIACISNAFDPEVSGAADPCLGEAFVRNPNGGSVVYMGASRYGLGENSLSGHGPSFQYNDWIFRYTLQDTYQNIAGAGFTQAKIHLAGSAGSDDYMRWVHYCLNYTGDPSIKAHKEAGSGGGVPVYRFFNHVRGGHLYTISESERNTVMELPDWNYEGIKFNVHDTQASGTVPVYRFFNTKTGIHLYTISESERDNVMNLPGWNYEGIKFYVYNNQTAGATPVYRFFNHVRGGHLYTISESERDNIMELPQWTYEGISFYVIEL